MFNRQGMWDAELWGDQPKQHLYKLNKKNMVINRHNLGNGAPFLPITVVKPIHLVQWNCARK